MHVKSLSLALLAALTAATCLRAATSTTNMTATITAGGLAISTNAPSGTLNFGSQQIVSSAGEATVPQDASDDFVVTIADTRGTSTAVTVTAAITPLKLGATTHYRSIRVATSSATGGLTSSVNAVYAAPTGTDVTMASGVAAYNRHGSFTVTVTPQALSGTNARVGTYTGSIVFTLQ